MKIKMFLLIFTLSSFFSFIKSQTFCLNFEEISNDGTNFVVDIQIAGSSTFGLGTSNFQFTYNGSGISNPVLSSFFIPTPTYRTPTLTEPALNTASFNIELNFDPGYQVTTSFSSLARISFTIVNSAESSNLAWSYTGGSTGTVVFLDDDATQIFATATNTSCLIPLSVVLPISLTNFTAKISDADVFLNWESSSEINFSHYEIERSTDKQNWEEIGKTQGKGTASNSAVYQKVDINILVQAKSNILFYRLKMVDLDNTFEYSPIQAIHMSYFNRRIRFSPNPVSNLLTIDLAEWKDSPVLMTLVDIQGKRVFEKNISSSFQVNTSTFPAGMYLLKIQELNGDILLNERVVIQ